MFDARNSALVSLASFSSSLRSGLRPNIANRRRTQAISKTIPKIHDETTEKFGVRQKSKEDWLAPVATALSLVACYGTLAAVALLGALGVTIALNQAVWAGAIVLFAGLTFVALLIRRRKHGRLAPVTLAGIGFLLIGFTMLISYARVIEFVGFVFLCGGTVLDWYHGRSQAEARV